MLINLRVSAYNHSKNLNGVNSRKLDSYIAIPLLKWSHIVCDENVEWNINFENAYNKIAINSTLVFKKLRRVAAVATTGTECVCEQWEWTKRSFQHIRQEAEHVKL